MDYRSIQRLWVQVLAGTEKDIFLFSNKNSGGGGGGGGGRVLKGMLGYQVNGIRVTCRVKVQKPKPLIFK